MSLNLENHIQPDGYVHIYTDGSYFEKKQRIGTGFVIKSAQSGTDPIIMSKSHEAPKRAPSLCAEASAVLDALEQLPKNTKVKIFTDELKIKKFIELNEDKRRVATARMDISILRSVLEQLSEACTKQKDIIAERVDHDKPINHEEAILTTAAHNAAATGSGASSHKMVPNMDTEESIKHAGFKPRHPNNGAFDIIEPKDGAESFIDYPDPRDQPFKYNI